MIEVEIFLDDSGRIREFTLQGHAGFAPHGSDIVCAGVSILAQTAVMGLYKYLTAAPRVEKEAGLLRCLLPVNLPEKEMDLAQVILQTMLLGLEATEQNYRKYIRIYKRRWTECL